MIGWRMTHSRVRVRRAPWFRVAALAAALEPKSFAAAADAISRELGRPVSAQPVRDFLAHDMPMLADRTIAIKRPQDIGLHVELLLFHREAANVNWFVNRMKQEVLAARIDRFDGRFNVGVEVIAESRDEVTAIVERYEALERLVLLDRLDDPTSALFQSANRKLALSK